MIASLTLTISGNLTLHIRAHNQSTMQLHNLLTIGHLHLLDKFIDFFYSKIVKSNQKSATNFLGKKELMHNGLKKKERKKENRISEDSYHLETRQKSWRKEEKNKNKRNPSHYGSWSLPSQLVSSKSGWTETNKISSQVLQTWVCMRWLDNLLQMKVKKEERGKNVERKGGFGCSEGILFGK